MLYKPFGKKSLIKGKSGIKKIMGKITVYVPLDDNGRVTIPKYVREGMELKYGDILEIVVSKYLDSRK